MNGRDKRRVLGVLHARLPEARLDRVPDPRARHARGRSVRAILTTIAGAMAAGCRSLAHAEAFSDEMAPAARPVLGIRGRMPDTTMRDLVTKLDIEPLRRAHHRVIRRAHRRKALTHDELPFGVASLDGRDTAVSAWDDEFAQRQVHGGSVSGACGLVRSITSLLATSRARPCLDVSPIPPDTNEDGHYLHALDELIETYRGLDLFRMVAYDSGGCSKFNADATRQRHLHYFFRLDDKQPTLAREAERLLAHRPVEQADASTEELTGRGLECRFLFLTSEMAGFHGWTHLRTVLRVRREIWSEDGALLSAEDRYAISSLGSDRLRSGQWLHLMRIRWSVENEGHNTFDTSFAEDDRPWIEANPRGTVALMVLRRLVYTLLALYRAVTQRSEERRRVPWATLMRWLYNAFIGATPEDVARLRPRRCPVTDG